MELFLAWNSYDKGFAVNSGHRYGSAESVIRKVNNAKVAIKMTC
jgi:hypothetical protein